MDAIDLKPLEGVVVCCTGLSESQRNRLFSQARELGADCQADLTADVTHLVCVDTTSPKYVFCARHRPDLAFMRTDWIEAIHEQWLAGHDISPDDYEIRYRLPTFYNARVCATGLDIQERAMLERLIISNGGIYTGDLTRENTHLVAAKPSGHKYEATVAWNCGIQVVGIEWAIQSDQRGAMLDGKFFPVTVDAEKRGKGAFILGNATHIRARGPRKTRAPVTQHDNDSLLAPADGDTSTTTAGEKRKRDSRRLASRKRLSKRMSGVGDDVWNSIADYSAGTDSAIDDNAIQHSKLPDSTVDGVSAHGSWLNDDQATSADAKSKVQLHASVHDLVSESASISRGCFDGRSFFCQGFDARRLGILERVLTEKGGIVLAADAGPDSCMLIVPQNGQPPDEATRQNRLCATEYWVERCLVSNKYEEPSAHFVSRPFICSFPIAQMDQLAISVSGLTDIELTHVEKLISMVGARFSDKLDRDCSILLTPTRECRKFVPAKQWGVRVATVDWLYACITRQRLLALKDYALDGVQGQGAMIDGRLSKLRACKASLHGLRCYVSPTVSAADAAQVTTIAKKLGIEMVNETEDATHILGALPADSAAPSSNALIVDHHWLERCLAAGQRLAEQSCPVEGGAGMRTTTVAGPRDPLANLPAKVNQDTTKSAPPAIADLKQIQQRLASNGTTAGRSLTSATGAGRKLVGRARASTRAHSAPGGDGAAAVPGSAAMTRESSNASTITDYPAQQTFAQASDRALIMPLHVADDDLDDQAGSGIRPSQAVIYSESEARQSRLLVFDKLRMDTEVNPIDARATVDIVSAVDARKGERGLPGADSNSSMLAHNGSRSLSTGRQFGQSSGSYNGKVHAPSDPSTTAMAVESLTKAHGLDSRRTRSRPVSKQQPSIERVQARAEMD